MGEFEKLNKEATRLIERSIIKNRIELTPQREISKIQKLDLSGAKLIKQKIKLRKNSLAKKTSPNIMPSSVSNLKLKKKRKSSLMQQFKRKNLFSKGNSLQTSLNNGNIKGNNSYFGAKLMPNSFSDRYATVSQQQTFSLPFRNTYQSSFRY